MKIPNRQKPIDYDLHLKYICSVCGDIHWLSFKETSTNRFKVVCDCGHVFGVKQTSKLKINYKSHKKIKESNKETATPSIEEIPIDLLNKSIKILVSYGFTSGEASELLKKFYASNPIKDVSLLIKQSLASLRG